MTSAARALLSLGALLALAGIGLRFHNARVYPLHRGFDAKGNWEYIAQLVSDWSLPAPGDGWATSHPPFFYYLGAAIARALGEPDVFTNVVAIRLVCAAFGLVPIVLAVWLVRRSDPERPERALIAGALLLFLPVHIYMSAMLGEELVVAAFSALTITGTAVLLAKPPDERSWGAFAAIGLAGGLAFLTKLTGVLAVVAAGAAIGIDALRRRTFGRGLQQVVLVAVVAGLVGGWYYARNLATYGYLYPEDLQVHAVMFEMPPGERGVGDYLQVPWSTFSDPQLVDPDLLHSVWGSTYATVWFDGHRHFLPRTDPAVRRVGTALAVLALLPTCAWGIGLARGTRRTAAGESAIDGPLVLLTFATFAGYVLFTWSNPWFASVKGSYLLGLCVPFAYHASDVLADWTRRGGAWGALVWAGLAALVVLSAATFTLGLVFWKPAAEGTGLLWRSVGIGG